MKTLLILTLHQFQTKNCNYYEKSNLIVQCNHSLCTVCMGRKHNGSFYGHIKENKIKNKSLFYAYHEETTPFNDNRCRECFAFPICSGGCAWYRLKNLKEDKDFNFCSLFIDKSILEKCLLKNFDNVTINNNSPKIKVC